MGRDDTAVPPGALSPCDAAAPTSTVALLRDRLGDQLVSLSADRGVDGTAPRRAGFGGTGFSSLQS
ncbi:hypothetical protein [Azospirillum agricola]|uniref:hypothetical protein n=1 Tax=Azospirillum agricola TaxID=1720247 RepID=UPI000A0F133F|nr:hypothetical protein [Azospirillum agricola]SMH52266.1 hypothetical protein SAMN02982994_3084 [Azospirillum lipoferum]